MNQHNLMKVVQNSWVNGGFTLRADGRDPVFSLDTWLVSLGGREQRFSQRPQDRDIFQYIQRHSHKLSEHDVYLGGWVEHYLDVSVPIVGIDSALDFARLHKQIAIYEPATGCCVDVDYSGSVVGQSPVVV